MDVKNILRRESQLNLIAYLIILALIVVVALLIYALLNQVKMPDIGPLSDYTLRVLIGGLIVGMILYMADQHRRLRKKLVQAHEQLNEAQDALQTSYSRLAFAHHASSVMTSLEHEDGLPIVLDESLEAFGADAAAVVGDEVTLMTKEGVDGARARDQVLAVALEAVRAGKPLSTSPAADASQAIAVPLPRTTRLRFQLSMARSERTKS